MREGLNLDFLFYYAAPAELIFQQPPRDCPRPSGVALSGNWEVSPSRIIQEARSEKGHQRRKGEAWRARGTGAP